MAQQHTPNDDSHNRLEFTFGNPEQVGENGQDQERPEYHPKRKNKMDNSKIAEQEAQLDPSFSSSVPFGVTVIPSGPSNLASPAGNAITSTALPSIFDPLSVSSPIGQGSATALSFAVDGNAPKKRGRPRKGISAIPSSEPSAVQKASIVPKSEELDTNENIQTSEELAAIDSLATGENLPQSKRGRPTKTSPQESTPFAQFASAPTSNTNGTPKKRGRPAKNATAKRGRPPKFTSPNSTPRRRGPGRPRKPALDWSPSYPHDLDRNTYASTSNINRNLNPEGWTPDEDQILIDSVLESLATPPWTDIAGRIPNRDAAKCFNRWATLKRRLYREQDSL
ncbi:hypothetical protein G9A89_011498 [Geosiphon pyriformis]|nr:hypothetical protein G9A89_011498 [Geosiphon pyriformis]